MSFNVLIEKRAIKGIKKLSDNQQRRILVKTKKILSVGPFPNSKNPIRLKPAKNAVYRLRIGKYRVLYKILKNSVLIFDIDHRKDIYK